MAGRLSLDDRLAAIRELRGQALSAPQVAELKKAVGDRSNLLVAAAAEIVGDQTLLELAGDLEAAFARFLVNPIRDDKLCRAKIAIIQALDRIEHIRSAVFERASTHIQLEPVWGGTEDTAAPLRATALIALARIEGSAAQSRLVDAMVDPIRDVRIAAAQGLAYLNTDAAGLLLRLKVRIGDADPEVLSECLAGLLADGKAESLAIVRESLGSRNEARCEAAALALGKSRRADAFEPLRDAWYRALARRRPAGPAVAGHAPPVVGDRLPGRAGGHRVREGRDGLAGGPQDPQLRPEAPRAPGACRPRHRQPRARGPVHPRLPGGLRLSRRGDGPSALPDADHGFRGAPLGFCVALAAIPSAMPIRA